MKIETAQGIAAQCWCEEPTQHIEMDVVLGDAFARRLVKEMKPMEDAIEMAWGIIANACGGDWDYTGNHKDWKGAAEKWRDECLPLMHSAGEDPS